MAEKEQKKIPIGSKEDVEYSRELADQDDREAMQRAKAAEQRQLDSQSRPR